MMYYQNNSSVNEAEYQRDANQQREAPQEIKFRTSYLRSAPGAVRLFIIVNEQ